MFQISVKFIFIFIYLLKTYDTSDDIEERLDEVKIPQKPKPGCECQACPEGYEIKGNECCGGWDSDPPDSHCLPDYYLSLIHILTLPTICSV